MKACPRCGLAHPAESTCPIAGALPPPPAAPLPLGAVVGGRFAVDAVAHRSDMSTVYRAGDLRHPGTMVALKESHTAGLAAAERAESLAWLAREAALLSTLSHPGLPRLLAAFSEGDRHYVAMPFLTGETLEERVVREGPQLEALVLAWGRALAALLSHLHGQDPPVIHRDLKPANILLRPDGSLVLLDLGVARRVARDGHGVVPGTAVGTPGYAAPEQYQGLADERSDLYSLGATLHRLLTAYQPDDEAPFRHPPLRDLAPDASPATQALLSALLELAPERRPAGMIAALVLLDAALPGARGRAYRPLRRMYSEVLVLLPAGLAASGLIYCWRYGLPNGRGAYRASDARGDSLGVLLVFLPGVLALVPLLRPHLRVLVCQEPLAALHLRWIATLLICCWVFPLLAWLLNFYLPSWGTLITEPGPRALGLALCSALLAIAGALVLRIDLLTCRSLPLVPRKRYLLAVALLAVWPASLFARTPVALGFCYVTAGQSGYLAMDTTVPLVAADRRGDLFVLDQNALQERTSDGIYHVLQLRDQASYLPGTYDFLAVADNGAPILSASDDPTVYQVSSADGYPAIVTTLPKGVLPSYASLVAGPHHALYYNDLNGGALYRIAGNHATAITPRPARANWRPDGLAVDSQGNLYTIDASTGTLERITPDGTVRAITSVPLARFDGSTQVRLSRADDGTLYAADGVRLVRITPSGTAQVLNSTDGISQVLLVRPPVVGAPPSVPLFRPVASSGWVPKPVVECSL